MGALVGESSPGASEAWLGIPAGLLGWLEVWFKGVVGIGLGAKVALKAGSFGFRAELGPTAISGTDLILSFSWNVSPGSVPGV